MTDHAETAAEDIKIMKEAVVTGAISRNDNKPEIAVKKKRKRGDGTKKHINDMKFEKQRHRDLAVMKYLASGPATNAQLHIDLFKKEDGTKVRRQVFNRRMTKLCNMDLVKRQVYTRYTRSGPTILYALGDVGIEEIALNLGLEPQHIRNDFPPANMFKHEMLLASFVRIVRREEERQRYGIGFIYDDKKMRRDTPIKEMKKYRGRLFYPDLRMRLIPHHKNGFYINIELDTGRKQEDYWKRKIGAWKDTTLVLALTQTRLNVLINITRGLGLMRPTGFALASIFAMYGFGATKWTWLPSNRIDVLDIGKSVADATS